MDEFLTVVIRQSTTVWFNTSNFPKTEVGSGKSGAPVQTLENLEMKKTLVAIAALAAFGAQAQSSFTIDGGFDAGYQAINYKGNKVSGINNNGSYTSQINFRGVQDLGGGLKADFRLESDINPVSKQANTGVANSANATTAANANNSVASTWGNGEARVGINGGFGRVDLGAVNFNGISTTGTGMPFGTAIGGGYGAMYRVDVAGTAIRDENAVKYTTPAFSGLNATLYKSNKQTKASNSTANSTTGIVTQQTTFNAALGAYDKLGSQEVGLNYANGPLAASYSTLTQDSVGVGAGVTESKVNTLGANYAVNNAAKVFFLNQTVKTTTGTVATDTSYNAFSATYTMGNTVLMASTGSLKQDGGTNAGKKSTITGLGADYNLSKTTALYARYESIKDEAKMITAASTIDGTDTKRTRTALGLRVTF